MSNLRAAPETAELRQLVEKMRLNGIRSIVNLDSIEDLGIGPFGAGPAAAIGGKDPCPCGSGKRYKRCCRGPSVAAPGESKISEALEQVAEPLLAPVDKRNRRELKQAFERAACGWNLAACPERFDDLTRMVRGKDLSRRNLDAIRQDVASLAARKAELFPDDRRVIGLVDVEIHPDGYFLTVASQLPL